MTITERLLSSVQEIWAGYHTHPFVMGIGDGSLDQEKFRYYMIQDYLYLIDYTRVFAVGVAKAKDLSVMKLFYPPHSGRGNGYPPDLHEASWHQPG